MWAHYKKTFSDLTPLAFTKSFNTVESQGILGKTVESRYQRSKTHLIHGYKQPKPVQNERKFQRLVMGLGLSPISSVHCDIAVENLNC